MKRTLATLALLATAASAHAALVNHSDVNGMRTFQDTNTGLIWADLDNWKLANVGAPMQDRFASMNDYLAAVQAAGFSWATTAQVDALLATVPLGIATNAQAAFATMMTDWGSMLEWHSGLSDGGSQSGNTRQVTDHHLAYASNPSWTSTLLSSDFTDSPSVGLYAYLAGPAAAPGGSVPAPATLTLAGLALAVAGFSRRSRA